MITRLESYTKDAAQNEPSPRAELRARLLRDVTVGLGVFAYLAFVLFDNIESPLLSIALVVLVAYELVQPHMRNR